MSRTISPSVFEYLPPSEYLLIRIPLYLLFPSNISPLSLSLAISLLNKHTPTSIIHRYLSTYRSISPFTPTRLLIPIYPLAIHLYISTLFSDPMAIAPLLHSTYLYTSPLISPSLPHSLAPFYIYIH